MKRPFFPIADESGSVLLLALMLVAVLSLLAMGATRNTGLELKIAANHRAHRAAFYAAEAGVSYAMADPGLYGGANIDPDTPLTDAKSPAANFSFSVSVGYDGVLPAGRALRGAGFSSGRFRAHSYRIDSQGRSVTGTLDEVQVRGYRVGL